MSIQYNIMRDKHYKIKQIRMSEPVWEELKDLKIKNGETWNLFLIELLKVYKKENNLNNKTNI